MVSCACDIVRDILQIDVSKIKLLKEYGFNLFVALWDEVLRSAAKPYRSLRRHLLREGAFHACTAGGGMHIFCDRSRSLQPDALPKGQQYRHFVIVASGSRAFNQSSWLYRLSTGSTIGTTALDLVTKCVRNYMG